MLAPETFEFRGISSQQGWLDGTPIGMGCPGRWGSLSLEGVKEGLPVALSPSAWQRWCCRQSLGAASEAFPNLTDPVLL